MKTLFAALILTLSLCAETGFLQRTLDTGTVKAPYTVYVPVNYDAKQKYPVILFLHGQGESGTDGIKQTAVGLPQALRLNPDRFPAIVVMPQSVPNKAWHSDEYMAVALKSLDLAMKEFSTDPDRVYLTGLSKGGYGTWFLAMKNPGKFAAIAVVCGGIQIPARARDLWGVNPPPTYAEVAKALGPKLPIRIFHGDDDTAVSVEESRQMYAALKAEGAIVRYSEYPGVPHNSWDRAYNDPEFAKWLFAQKK